MNEQSLLKEVNQVIATTFGCAEDLPGKAMGSIPGWDSMGHMMLVAALENHFDIRFPTHALAELTSPESIAQAISGLKES
jgi:acyl carrier protein